MKLLSLYKESSAIISKIKAGNGKPYDQDINTIPQHIQIELDHIWTKIYRSKFWKTICQVPQIVPLLEKSAYYDDLGKIKEAKKIFKQTQQNVLSLDEHLKLFKINANKTIQHLEHFIQCDNLPLLVKVWINTFYIQNIHLMLTRRFSYLSQGMAHKIEFFSREYDTPVLCKNGNYDFNDFMN